MKKLTLSLLLPLFACLGMASFVAAGSMPAMQVVVSNSANKVVYKGMTNTRGVFETPKLAPGNYVVQFNTKKSLKGDNYFLVVSAGKKKVVANAVSGDKFSKGGVAMKVDVGSAMMVTGQVSDAEIAATAQSGGQKADGRKTKMINGKKYVWVEGEMGSNLGGRWVDADSPAAQNVEQWDRKHIQDFQSNGSHLKAGN